MAKFEEVLPEIKQGEKAYRAGWNGKGLYVYMMPGHTVFRCRTDMEDIKVNPYLMIRQADNTRSTWVPSVGDIFAEDWEVMGNE